MNAAAPFVIGKPTPSVALRAPAPSGEKKKFIALPKPPSLREVDANEVSRRKEFSHRSLTASFMRLT